VRQAALAAAIVAAGSFEIGRRGYSVDEEFTEFAVRGILTHGIPLLPSGLLYDRGLAYSYASALINGRIVSLICGALIVAVTFSLVRRHHNSAAGWLAAVLVATSVPFWATATTARFYAPFLLAFLIAIANLRRWQVLIAAAFVARLLHELAFLLPLIPLLCAIGGRGERRRWLLAGAAAIGGLLAGQLVLFAMHALDPPSGDTMVRRFFLWQVLNLFEQPGERQFGIALVVMAVGVLLMPRHRSVWIIGSLSIAAMIAAYSIARASNSAPLSFDLIATTLQEGARYPLDMFWYIARTTPLTLAMAIGGLISRAAGIGGEWRPAERAAHLLWIGWVLWFGVIESGITTNYLLLPISFMLIAVAVDAMAIAGSKDPAPRSKDPAPRSKDPAPRRRRLGMVAAVIVLAVVLDQWRGEGSIHERLEAARPTIRIEGIEEIAASLQPNDRVVCTDELGCLMLVGRIDRWLALDDYVRERFLVRRSETVTGVYTGVPAIMRPAEIFSANPDGSLPDRTIVIDIFKEYPIGNSRAWLPKAIEEDGLGVIPLLETPQARVLQISPQERVARLR
jgi:hypothetical protein